MDTEEITAVFLAAGRGRRLGASSEGRPKGAIQVGGRSLFEHTLSALTLRGVRSCLVVTGYQADWYHNHVSRGMALSFVHNPDFAKFGSLHSLALAARQVTGSAIVIESDLLFDGKLLDAMLAQKGDAVVATSISGTGDEVYVAARRARLLDLSKSLACLRGPVVGEFVGVSRLTQATLAQILAFSAVGANSTLEYEDALVAVAQTTRIPVVAFEKLTWAEIDTERDLDRARTEIWPLLRTNHAV